MIFTPRVVGLRAIWSLKMTGSVQLEHLFRVSISRNSDGSEAYVLSMSFERDKGTPRGRGTGGRGGRGGDGDASMYLSLYTLLRRPYVAA